MAYAAGINDANPAYFDDLREGGLNIHPGICFSLQWASRFRPDQKPNLRAAPYGVHASTDLRIYRPFKPGEAITTQGRLVQKRQFRSGIYSVDRYRMTASNGELIAELDYNGITRGATLDGPDVIVEEEMSLPRFPDVTGEPLIKHDEDNPGKPARLLRDSGRADFGPLKAHWRKEIPIGLHAGQQYTECARIYNPIHTEPSVARAAGLPDIILHGSATKAMSLSAVVNQCFDGDATRVTLLCGQLRGMVLMNSVISVEGLAEEVVDGEKRVFFRTVIKHDEENPGKPACLLRDSGRASSGPLKAPNKQGQSAISNGIVCGV